MELEAKLSAVRKNLIACKYPFDYIDDAIQAACLCALEKDLKLDDLATQWYFITARNILINNLKRDKRYISLENLKGTS